MCKEKGIPASINNTNKNEQIPLFIYSFKSFFLRLGSLAFGTTVRTENQQFNLSGVTALITCSEHNFSSPYKSQGWKQKKKKAKKELYLQIQLEF